MAVKRLVTELWIGRGGLGVPPMKASCSIIGAEKFVNHTVAARVIHIHMKASRYRRMAPQEIFERLPDPLAQDRRELDNQFEEWPRLGHRFLDDV